MENMKPSLEIIAPSVEEAIERGIVELGIDREDLDVEVLDEGGKGLLGIGARQARVRLTLRQGESDEPVISPAAGVADAGDVDDRILHVAKETVEELLLRMGFKTTVSVRWSELSDPEDQRHVLVDVTGDDLGVLIGRRSENLVALQYVTRLIVGKELQGQAPVVIDIGQYRARREKQLRQMARRMAEQAAEDKRTLTLEPMPPNERRIIHIELRDNPEVTTESIDEGERRKVTIIPRQIDTAHEGRA